MGFYLNLLSTMEHMAGEGERLEQTAYYALLEEKFVEVIASAGVEKD